MYKFVEALSILVSITSLFLQLEAHRKLPVFLIPCENDSNLSNCTRWLLEELRPYLVQGIPKLKVPSVDPMRIPRLTRTQRDSSIANYKTILTNLVWTGGKHYEIVDTVVDVNDFVYRLKLEFPYLHMECDAFIDGHFMGFQVNGIGVFSVNYTNVALDIILNGKQYRRRGKEFIEWSREDIEIRYEEVYLTELHGFFEDPTLAKILKITINNAARLLGQSFRAAIDLSIGKFLVDVINRVHKSFPKNMLYRNPK